jgi:hypothetical protein
LFLFARGIWPGEVVVYNVFGVPVIDLQSATDIACPRHVHCGHKNAEVIQSSVCYNMAAIMRYMPIGKKTNRNIPSFFGRYAGNKNKRLPFFLGDLRE